MGESQGSALASTSTWGDCSAAELFGVEVRELLPMNEHPAGVSPWAVEGQNLWALSAVPGLLVQLAWARWRLRRLERRLAREVAALAGRERGR